MSITVTHDFYVENICYSGGAKGADEVFGECAIKAGHNLIHYSFKDHRTAMLVYRLTDEELRTADFELKRANQVLKRTFPTSNEYVDNLLRRNYFQIREAGKIYAVTALNSNGIPYGGTAWAIVMGINQGIREIYVFDCNENCWLYYDGPIGSTGYCWIKKSMNVPRPIGHYAGIGSRDLPDNGRKAIEDLYK